MSQERTADSSEHPGEPTGEPSSAGASPAPQPASSAPEPAEGSPEPADGSDGESAAAAQAEQPEPAPAAQQEAPAAAQQETPGVEPRPAPRRPEREAGAPPPVVRAQAKYVRTSARKARLVCEHLRGKTVAEARAILAHTPRAVARDWSRLLESAVANAEQNHELVGEDLYVKAVYADEGPTIKRFRPRAMGRATRIRKRTSHLTIMLTPKE
jgi:ribosomal protein L22